MERNYELDTEDEKILEELDNLCGVVQNKNVLRDMIIYAKLREKHKIDFGNYNILLNNQSVYKESLEEFLKVCSKIFLKYHIISNDNICYLDRNLNNRRDSIFDKLLGIKDGIIVINERKIRSFDFSDDLNELKKISNKFEGQIFVFEDTGRREDDLGIELGEFVSWRMNIERTSLEDKIIYCKKKLDENNIKYKEKDLKEFADIQFWILKHMMFNLLIECKSKDLDFVDKQMLKKTKESFSKNNKSERRECLKKIEHEKTAIEELNELVGLEDVKRQMEKIINYIKLNKERGKMPSLHMCFTGNPRYRKD